MRAMPAAMPGISLIQALAAVLIAAALALCPPIVKAAERERILSFSADITVGQDSILEVVETIEVVATGDQIRRGIFRDFPIRSITPLGLDHVAGFEVTRILRDGRKEPYFFSELNAGVRIYIGREDVFLEPGRYRYTIAYRTDRQLLHRDGEDELYWNVTGDAWAFPIEKADVTVHLPEGALATAIAGYTGRRGETGDAFRVLDDDGSTVRLATTERLDPKEGFTIAVVWPEGYVARPSSAQEIARTARDNAGVILGLGLLAVLLAYYILMWRRVGRDPEKGVIIPLFDPPEHLSPIAVGYVWNEGFGGSVGGGRAMTVALTSLATKGVVEIEDLGNGEFRIEKTDATPPGLPAGEAALLDTLFMRGSASSITFGKKYRPRIGAARRALTGAFGAEFDRLYFRRNRFEWAIGAVIGAAAVLGTLLTDAANDDARLMVLFMTPFAAAFSVPSIFMISRLIRFRGGRGTIGRLRNILATVMSLAVGGAFLVPVGIVGSFLSNVVSPAAIVVAALPFAVVLIFWFLLKAPTRLGRSILDEIEGYRMYLSVAEEDRLNQAGREPAITEALFEEHLPYARALGVEKEWTEKFSARLAQSARDPDEARRAWRPRWYHGTSGDWQGPDSLASSLSRGLGGAASVAASRPSSSGGGGGGGSSGGGGGGGGGGGW